MIFWPRLTNPLQQEDWDAIASHSPEYSAQLPDRVLNHLQILKGDYGGFAVDRLEHSLQTATRAWEAGEDEEYVVMALLHDIGDTLGSFNHPGVWLSRHGGRQAD